MVAGTRGSRTQVEGAGQKGAAEAGTAVDLSKEAEAGGRNELRGYHQDAGVESEA